MNFRNGSSKDTLLIHWQAPWVINGDFQAGIQAMLVVERSQEQNMLIAMSWFYMFQIR
jgi:hypothetical protein